MAIVDDWKDASHFREWEREFEREVGPMDGADSVPEADPTIEDVEHHLRVILGVAEIIGFTPLRYTRVGAGGKVLETGVVVDVHSREKEKERISRIPNSSVGNLPKAVKWWLAEMASANAEGDLDTLGRAYQPAVVAPAGRKVGRQIREWRE